ncbi:MAG: DNA polymerase III subunit alpha [Candidatus Sumerlaeia bacterium]|nr:DNA polymerase III subunit alpha [Candidatus Sumerlaeia bacterium]
MPAKPFVHLHLHSQYSLCDSTVRMDALCKALKDAGMTAAALTDHGNLFGALEFYQTLKAEGLKPILGCELYVAPTRRDDRGPLHAHTYTHLVVLARDLEGYRNLTALSSIGYLEGFYYKPRVDKETLAQYSRGLLALSACTKGVIAAPLLEGQEAAAEKALDDYRQIFGPDGFYVELMDHGLPEQKKVNPVLIRLAQKHNIPLVATNDVHYLRAGDHTAHDVLLCVGTGSVVSDPKRLRYESDQFYLKSPEEMESLFGSVDGALDNTVAIAEQCNLTLPLHQRLIPHFDPPPGETVSGYLRKLVYQGLEKRCAPVTEEKRRRVDMELDVIGRMGFESYFLIVWDFIHFAKEKGIPVGPGRGSVGGSLVSYCLEITDIDPLAYNLMFERFLNIGRITMPDIDIDFCYERRGEVIDYVRRKYGERNVAQIITFGTMKAKNAIRDVGRALNIDLRTVDEIAKLVPAELDITIDSALEKEPRLRERYEGNETIRQLIDTARSLEGLARHASTHAAGVVIADRPLIEYVPLYRTENEIVTQYSMEDVETIGLLKMDFLGLKNLTVIENTVRAVERNHGIRIDWDKIDRNDPETFRLFQEGDTFGVFQFESSGMQAYLRKLRPERFEDMIAMNALYRPGPLKAGMVDEYINRRHGLTEVRYLHPSLEPILRETYGVIVYQEQVAQIAAALAGYSLSEADLLRRAMGKKKKEVMKEQRAVFVEKATARGVSRQIAEQVFDLMDHFGGYGFNKSHSAAYAVIAFRTAYLKAHYPVEYMAALMTNDMGNTDRMPLYFAQCKAMGIQILPPDVNESDLHFTVVGRNIRFGLGAVKNVGHGAVESILAARRKGGPFRSLQDFCERVDLHTINSRMIACLIKAGACDGLGGHRAQLLAALDGLIEAAATAQREREAGQISLFEVEGGNGPGPAALSAPRLPDVPPWSLRETLQNEKQQVGFYISGHPLDEYVVDYYSFATSSIRRFREQTNGAGGEALLMGKIHKIVRKIDRYGNPIAFFELEDFTGAIECLAFRQAHAAYAHLIQDDAIVYVRGMPNSRTGDVIKCQVREIISAEEYRRKHARVLEIALREARCPREELSDLYALLARNKGAMPVRLIIPFDAHGHQLALQAGDHLRVALEPALLTELRRLPVIKRLTFRES